MKGANTMADKLSTVGGLKPLTDNENYSTTVEDIREILQGRLDSLIAVHNNRCVTDPEYGRVNKKIPDIKIYLNGLQCGTQFTVLNVVLPASVIISRKKDSVKDECSLFNPDGDDNQKRVELIPQVWSFFRNYCFSRKDVESFSSPQVQRALKLDRSKIAFLKAMAYPRVKNMNGETVVSFNLNTNTVIKDLLKKTDDPRPYDISIVQVKKIQGMNYKFFVERSVMKKGKGKNHSDEAAYIYDLMHGKKK